LIRNNRFSSFSILGVGLGIHRSANNPQIYIIVIKGERKNNFFY